ncbi:TniB family NTP-binding protein [Leisingera caerulea]|uniref:TniB family NTP-binding protein n=1 Tax=Leisingera caerulea TaxID=506591 RepID=A0A9Q9HI10_LEICA|nr:TniB family NTP-binding protein [Leisingera caerulea]UWQ54731.1 TniB family NTP-binding protein [Leisingera caerulea]
MTGVGSAIGAMSLEDLRSYHVETERDEQVLLQLNRLLKKDANGNPIPEPIRFTGNLETRGVAIIEASGGGKTTAVNRVLSRHPALKARPGEDWARYIRIQVPSPATLKSLGREVLAATGLPEVSQRLTAWEIWRLVRHRLALLGIVVLWFDEAHDMFLSGSAREIDDMLKMLKSLMQNDSAVILILSGTERLSEITSYDPQVNRRFTKVVPGPLVPGVDDADLLALIERFCSDVGLKLANENCLTDRLIHASRRRFGRAVEVILNAIEYALEEDSSDLTCSHFAVAWGMQEGCDWDNNVFAVGDWAALELDASAEDFEAQRTERQARQVGKK